MDDKANKLFSTGLYFESKKQIQSRIILFDKSEIVLVDYGHECKEMHHSSNDDNIYGIQIKADSIETASSIADIICSCFAIVEGYGYENSYEIINTMNRDKTNPVSLLGRKGITYSNDDLYLALEMAKRVYGNQILENSVSKYYVAQSVFPIHPLDLSPNEDIFRSDYILSDRVRISNVIIDCYSILEE